MNETLKGEEWDNPVGTSQCWIDEKGKPTKPFYWSKQ